MQVLQEQWRAHQAVPHVIINLYPVANQKLFYVLRSKKVVLLGNVNNIVVRFYVCSWILTKLINKVSLLIFQSHLAKPNNWRSYLSRAPWACLRGLWRNWRLCSHAVSIFVHPVKIWKTLSYFPWSSQVYWTHVNYQCNDLYVWPLFIELSFSKKI